MYAAAKWRLAVHRLRLRSADGASLVEFAVSLPLLVVLLVGILDFGGAFNLKQELNNAAREGAHFGAAQPTNDLCSSSCPAPASITAVALLVDSYMTTANINDCGLSSVLASCLSSACGSGPPWSYTASTGCAGTLTLTIARDPSPPPSTPSCSLSMSNYGGAGGPTVSAPCTNVAIAYPYQWHFNNVIQLISPGSSFALTTIPTDATAANQE
jgi:Flp pilus assembly protein TadG